MSSGQVFVDEPTRDVKLEGRREVNFSQIFFARLS
jgi:hypothetical protein